jgi:hypothetical protein
VSPSVDAASSGDEAWIVVESPRGGQTSITTGRIIGRRYECSWK